VPDWPLYDVSDHGRIRSWRVLGKRPDGMRAKEPKIRKPCINNNGYELIVFVEARGSEKQRTSGRLIHRLVAAAFVAGDQNLCVAHLDGNRRNNHFSNLKWSTTKENDSHKEAHGTRYRGDRHPSTKLCDRGVRAAIRLHKMGWLPEHIGRLFDMSGATIGNYVKGEVRKEIWKEEQAG
jgi:hypothetical protein